MLTCQLNGTQVVYKKKIVFYKSPYYHGKTFKTVTIKHKQVVGFPLTIDNAMEI